MCFQTISSEFDDVDDDDVSDCSSVMTCVNLAKLTVSLLTVLALVETLD